MLFSGGGELDFKACASSETSRPEMRMQMEHCAFVLDYCGSSLLITIGVAVGVTSGRRGGANFGGLSIVHRKFKNIQKLGQAIKSDKCWRVGMVLCTLCRSSRRWCKYSSRSLLTGSIHSDAPWVLCFQPHNVLHGLLAVRLLLDCGGIIY